MATYNSTPEENFVNYRHPRTGQVMLDRIDIRIQTETSPFTTFHDANAALQAIIEGQKSGSTTDLRTTVLVTVRWRDGRAEPAPLDIVAPDIAASVRAAVTRKRDQAAHLYGTYYIESGERGPAEEQRRRAVLAEKILSIYQLEDDGVA